MAFVCASTLRNVCARCEFAHSARNIIHAICDERKQTSYLLLLLRLLQPSVLLLALAQGQLQVRPVVDRLAGWLAAWPVGQHELP